MISLLQSASFFLVHFVIILFERFKLISSDVSSLFLLDIECFKLIRRFKSISSWHRAFQAHQTFQAYFFLSYRRAFQAHFIKCFKLISSDVSSLFLLDIWHHWSRLTIDSCLLHACSRACFVRVYYTHVVELVSFMFTTCM